MGVLQLTYSRRAIPFEKHTFCRAEKEVANIRRIGCRILPWHEQIDDLPVMLDEALPTPARVALVEAETVCREPRNLLSADGLNSSEKKVYGMFGTDEPRPIDELVENTGLNSSDVLATLFTLGEERPHPPTGWKAVRQGFVVKGTTYRWEPAAHQKETRAPHQHD